MITSQNLSAAVAYLIKNDTTFELLKQDFPEILADLISNKKQPNCSCKNRVNKFFQNKIAQDSTILDKYITDKDAFIADLNKTLTIKQANSLSGKIFTLPKNEEAWSLFAKQFGSKTFKGFTIVEKDEEITVYFL